MSQRPNITTAFLFDKKWETSLRKLKPKDFYKLFWELYDFQMSGGRIPVPTHEENILIGTVVSFIVPQIENRLVASGLFAYQTNSGSPASRASAPASEQFTARGRGATGGTTGGATPPATPKLSQDKMSQDKISSSLSQVERELTDIDGKTAVEGGLPPASPTQQERKSKKQAYGACGNVLLTPDGYSFLTESLGIPEAYIDYFSEKLRERGYQYPDHAAALTAWWEEEKNKLYWKHTALAAHSSSSASDKGSFELDDFFELAVKKSLEDNA